MRRNGIQPISVISVLYSSDLMLKIKRKDYEITK